MKVKELIERLSKLNPELVVYKTNYDGCEECNPEGLENYCEVYEVSQKDRGSYPNDKLKNIVVI